MPATRFPRLHPHEWLFGGFLMLTALRLFAVGAWDIGLAFTAMAASIAIAAEATTRWPVPIIPRLRLLVLPGLVNLVYLILGVVVSRLHLQPCDAGLLHIDRWVFGETPALAYAGWATPALTEFLSACYMLFFPSLIAVYIIAQIRPADDALALYNGLFGMYAVGFLGYTMVPAAGPHHAMSGLFPIPLQGGILTSINASVVAAGSNRVDVFPSLHTAVTVFLMGRLWLRDRRWFLLLLTPAAGIVISTMYLRYHYAVDVAAGLCLAAAGLWLSQNKPPTSS